MVIKQENQTQSKFNFKAFFQVLLVFGIYALIGLALAVIYWSTGLTITDIQTFLINLGTWGYLLFIILQVLTNVLLFIIPGQTLQFIALGLALYSPLETFVLVLIGMVFASFINFLIGRFLGKRYVTRIIGEETYLKYQNRLATKAYIYYPLMMLLPFFPDDEITLLVGLTKMNILYFLFSTILTRAVGIAIFTFIPGQINFDHLDSFTITLICLGIVHCAVMLFYLVKTLEQVISRYLK